MSGEKVEENTDWIFFCNLNGIGCNRNAMLHKLGLGSVRIICFDLFCFLVSLSYVVCLFVCLRSLLSHSFTKLSVNRIGESLSTCLALLTHSINNKTTQIEERSSQLLRNLSSCEKKA